MKVRFARSISASIGLSLCSVASAQYTLPDTPYNAGNSYAASQYNQQAAPPNAQRFYVAPPQSQAPQPTAAQFNPRQFKTPTTPTAYNGPQVYPNQTYSPAAQPYPMGQPHPIAQNRSVAQIGQPIATRQAKPSFSGYQAPAKWNNYNVTPGQRSNAPVAQRPQFRPNQQYVPVGTDVNEFENLLTPAPDAAQSVIQGSPANVSPAPPQSVPQHVQTVPQNHAVQHTQPVQHAQPVPQNYGAPIYGAPVAAAPVQGQAGCTSCQQGVPHAQHVYTDNSYVDNSYVGDSYTMPITNGMISGGGFCDTGCGPVRPRLSPWFGGVNFLFLQVENDYVRNLVVDDVGGGARLSTNDIDPGSNFASEISFGRYLGCGRYGIGFTYLNFDPDPVFRDVMPPVANSYRVALPQLRDITIDPYGNGAGANPPAYGDATAHAASVYDYMDIGAAFRARRDIDIQGFEINLSCFGLSGAQRAAGFGGCGMGGLKAKLCNFMSGGCGGGCGGSCGGGCSSGGCGSTCGTGSCGTGGCGTGAYGGGCGTPVGYGGFGGPIVRPCNGRVQFLSSHGVRFFQLRDNYELQVDIDGTAGYQANDIYYNTDVENNLWGYQFGAGLNYCLNCRWSFGVGGKFGIYGNDVRFRHRVGTATNLAYINGLPADTILTDDRDTVMSTLGELDMNVGCRLTDAISLRGGYRMIGVTSVATSINSYPDEYSSLASARRVWADDSLIMHGGYFGVNYNW